MLWYSKNILKFWWKKSKICTPKYFGNILNPFLKNQIYFNLECEEGKVCVLKRKKAEVLKLNLFVKLLSLFFFFFFTISWRMSYIKQIITHSKLFTFTFLFIFILSCPIKTIIQFFFPRVKLKSMVREKPIHSICLSQSQGETHYPSILSIFIWLIYNINGCQRFFFS